MGQAGEPQGGGSTRASTPCSRSARRGRGGAARLRRPASRRPSKRRTASVSACNASPLLRVGLPGLLVSTRGALAFPWMVLPGGPTAGGGGLRPPRPTASPPPIPLALRRAVWSAGLAVGDRDSVGLSTLSAAQVVVSPRGGAFVGSVCRHCQQAKCRQCRQIGAWDGLQAPLRRGFVDIVTCARKRPKALSPPPFHTCPPLSLGCPRAQVIRNPRDRCA